MDSASARTGTGGRAAGSRSDAKKGRAGGLTSKHVGGHKPTLAASTTASTSHLHEVKSTAKPEGLSCKETFQRKRGGTRSADSTACKTKTDLEEISDLKKENSSIKEELKTVRALYQQLLHEAPSEKYGEMRVHLLKSQVLQLERQVQLLSHALSARTDFITDLQNALDSLLESAEEQRRKQQASMAPVHVVAAPDFTEKVKKLKERLRENCKTSSIEQLAQPVLFLDDFLRPRKKAFNSEEQNTVSLLDICTAGDTQHINLKYASRLETKLADLYHQLCQLESLLLTLPTSDPQQRLLQLQLQPMKTHLSDHVTRTRQKVGECGHGLLCLSLLVPTAPWPPLKGTEVSPVIDAASILEKLPPFLKNKKEGQEVIRTATKTFSYLINMNSAKCSALEKELEFHKSVYKLQSEYLGSLFTAVSDGYKAFEDSVQEVICRPLQELLFAYEKLSTSVCDESPKMFFLTFKEHATHLNLALEHLKTRTDGQGLEALSEFGELFFRKLWALEKQALHHAT